MIYRTRSELMSSQYNELEKLLWDAVDNRFSYHQAVTYISGMIIGYLMAMSIALGW